MFNKKLYEESGDNINELINLFINIDLKKSTFVNELIMKIYVVFNEEIIKENLPVFLFDENDIDIITNLTNLTNNIVEKEKINNFLNYLFALR